MAKFTRVKADDPNRCQATHSDQQCPFRAVGTIVKGEWEGPKYCPRHGGNSGQKAEKIAEKRLYLAAMWRDQIGTQSDHPKIKNLSEEVGILRMTLNKKLESVKSDQDLLMHSGAITTLIREIKEVVRAWQHIEERTGQVLDRTRMNVFTGDLINILTRYVDDPDVLQMIGEDIAESLDVLFKTGQPTGDKTYR